ncbi:hypothetical protein LW135_06590 [Helicobacter sp. faydin-H20]|uniref:hypothetical protein n=1 Tax=Helicobacter anatolicus TaxID=2905874 RepID=UPI001E302F88|nr:hypothetical protein [Helicobacter anatolicus]MCE3037487.1 hypothetical protein [Helicobacter anatolicus]
MEKIYFSEIREKIYELEKLYDELELISKNIRGELETRGLYKQHAFIDYYEFTFFCGEYTHEGYRELVYDTGLFKFNIYINNNEKSTIGTGFIKEMIKKYKINSIYEKINNLTSHLSEVIYDVCDKLEKEKGFNVIVGDFNPLTLKFEISAGYNKLKWHEITINGIDFEIECRDDIFEFLVDLLKQPYL